MKYYSLLLLPVIYWFIIYLRKRKIILKLRNDFLTDIKKVKIPFDGEKVINSITSQGPEIALSIFDYAHESLKNLKPPDLTEASILWDRTGGMSGTPAEIQGKYNHKKYYYQCLLAGTEQVLLQHRQTRLIVDAATKNPNLRDLLQMSETDLISYSIQNYRWNIIPRTSGAIVPLRNEIKKVGDAINKLAILRLLHELNDCNISDIVSELICFYEIPHGNLASEDITKILNELALSDKKIELILLGEKKKRLDARKYEEQINSEIEILTSAMDKINLEDLQLKFILKLVTMLKDKGFQHLDAEYILRESLLKAYGSHNIRQHFELLNQPELGFIYLKRWI